jgi:ribose 5-phosphate isomerase A
VPSGMDNTPGSHSLIMDRQVTERAKKDAGYRAAELVGEGMVIGLGTGSTVVYAMERLGARIAEGAVVTGVPTSYQAAIRAREFGIPLTSLDEHPVLDLAIDGADQVDPDRRLIKGRGAAQTREKCVAAAAKHLVIVVHASKIAGRLDAPVPVEVIPFALTPVREEIVRLGGLPVLREGIGGKDGPVVTDNGNFILDCLFKHIGDPEALEQELDSLPGVLCSGLFTRYADKTTVVIGEANGTRMMPDREKEKR